MVQHQIRGMVHPIRQVLNRSHPELIHSEDGVGHVGDAVDVVLEYVNAERMIKLCRETEMQHRQEVTSGLK